MRNLDNYILSLHNDAYAAQNGDVHVLSSFGVPFGEVGEEDDRKLLLDTESLKQQVEIVLKASSKLAVVGWYVMLYCTVYAPLNVYSGMPRTPP